MRLILERSPSPTNIIIGTGLPPCTPVRIYHPTAFTETILAGSKVEHGPGGFEVLSYPGKYRLDVTPDTVPYTFGFRVDEGRTALRFVDDPAPPPTPPPEPTPPGDDPELRQMVTDLGEALHSAGLAHELALQVYQRMAEYVQRSST
jgi:hypothetical protein